MQDEILKLKNQVVVAFLTFLALGIFYSLFWGPLKKYGDSVALVKTITISAEGKVVVSPDIARLSFSVVSEGTNPKTLADDNIKKMNAAIDFVKSRGIDEKDIKTTQYDLSPRYNYDRDTGKSQIYGYTLTQTILVKIRDLSKVADVLAGLSPLGINQISSVSFDIDDPEKFLAEARSQAFDKAKAKAESMAQKNNVKLGEVVSFSENQGYAPAVYQNFKTMGAGTEVAAAPQIQSGSQEVSIQVNITYRLK